jgi:hypothetical protein
MDPGNSAAQFKALNQSSLNPAAFSVEAFLRLKAALGVP